MKFIERLKKDKETIDRLTDNKSKVLFLWDYYKIPIFAIVVVIAICITMTVNHFTKKPILFKAVLINSDSQILEVDESVFEKELSKYGVDVEGKIVDVNDYLTFGMKNKEEEDIETLQVLNALFSISDLDVFVGFKDNFDMFIEKDAFVDLSLLIDKNLLEKNDADLYKYKDSNGNQIVGGVILHSDSPIHKANYYHSDVIIGVTNNAYYMDNAIAFVSQLLVD